MFEALPVRRISPCTIGVWLPELDDESRANLEAAFALPASELSHAAIRKAIIEETKKRFSVEKRFAAESIAAHRNGECRCSKA